MSDKLIENDIIHNRRQRASHIKPNLDGLNRNKARDKVIEGLEKGTLSQGEALKMLWVQVLGIKQDDFAQMVKVSRKTLSDVENDKGNYSVGTLNQIFRPFGSKVGLVRIWIVHKGDINNVLLILSTK